MQKTGASHCMVHTCLKTNSGNLVIAPIFSVLIFKNVCPGDLWLMLGSTAETVSSETQTL